MSNSAWNMDTGWHKLGRILIYFSGIGLILSSIAKFIRPAKLVAYLGFLGYEHDKLFFIATIELVIAILFLMRSTRRAGVLLVSSYLGGAIAAHLASHAPVGGGPFLMFTANHPYLSTVPPNVFIWAAWLGVWLSEPEPTQAAERVLTQAPSASMR